MELIGLDVGFSAHRRSSGVACLDERGCRVDHTTADWSDRQRVIGEGFRALVTAIDAPVVPRASATARSCERIFCLGVFQRRCRCALSHVPGTGLRLREAGDDTAGQLESVTSARPLSTPFPRVWSGANIVEAFPNAFLGVMVPEADYLSQPTLRRGQKFDWLYEQWCDRRLFRSLADALELPGASMLAKQCQANRHHDQRAALVCLLTAGAVARGRYTAIGDPGGGHIFLPPWPLWAAWARIEVQRQRHRLPELEIWIDGSVYGRDDELPNR